MINPTDPRLAELLGRLNLDEKVLLLTGRDFWTTWPIEKIGLRRMVLSDGPSGVRGEHWDEREPSLNLPSATALASSWSTALAGRYGAAAAAEARRKHVDIVLGPTINLHRSPLGGRSFEAFSEDPLLTADLATAYVKGLQANGVAATPKHYVANEYETERFTASSVVSERALRELYLLAFEKPVTEGGAWVVMSSYNAVNGVTASESELLETPLNSEWGFDGVVVSDWTAVRSIAAARVSQDLAMPGPDGAWGGALAAAVRAGEVSEAAIDRKVLRILTLAARVGALSGFPPEVAEPGLAEDGVAFARAAEAEGMVLAQNDGLLPLTAATVRSIAVLGHNATVARTMGGGSATVIPEHIVSPLEGIRAAFPQAEIRHAIGAVVQRGIAQLPPSELFNSVTAQPGVHVRFLDAEGAELYSEDRLASGMVWLGSDAPVARTAVLELSTTWTPTKSGVVQLGFAGVGDVSFFVDGELFFEGTAQPDGDDFAAALLSPGSDSRPFDAVESTACELQIEYRRLVTPELEAAMAFSFGTEAPNEDPEALLLEAEELARTAEVVVLVVGTNSAVESEGFDRSNLYLPGRQDDLARRVLAANPNTIVVVNSGAPVVLPWRADAAAVLLSWFGGQEFGSALGDVLSGAVEPGGRVPTTWPNAQQDVPVLSVTPVAGAVRYDEGIHIGYRAWLRNAVTPAYPFGFGLGYTSWLIDAVAAAETITRDETVTVTISLRNTGPRAGKQVVQLYAARTESVVDRPVRWLVGFAVAHAAAGAAVTVTVEVSARGLAYWENGWSYEPGDYSLLVGTSIDDIDRTLTIRLVEPGDAG